VDLAVAEVQVDDVPGNEAAQPAQLAEPRTVQDASVDLRRQLVIRALFFRQVAGKERS
jgi:hypothetical protein